MKLNIKQIMFSNNFRILNQKVIANLGLNEFTVNVLLCFDLADVSN